MNNAEVSARSVARHLLPGLMGIMLLTTAWPAAAQDPGGQDGAPPDPAAKRAYQVRGGGQPVSVKAGRAVISEGFEDGVIPPSGGVGATISTSDPYVTWLYNTTSSYPDIAGVGTGTNSDDFDFAVDASTPDGHVIQFNLDITASNGGPWADSFHVPVECGGGQAQWAFLVYLDGDNNLEGVGIGDFLEMSSVGSTSDVHILVQFDRIPGYDSDYGDWTSTKRFRVTPGMTPTAANAIQDIGEANMGDPVTLIDFVQWGVANYPADHYAVVIWDHGSGWRLRPGQLPPLKDVAVDDTNGGDSLTSPELRTIMDTLSGSGSDPLDLVGFDACLMGMIEVDNQLIPYVDVRVGSEETEPGDGWPYDPILSALVGDPTMPASQLGTVIVDEYYASYGNGETQSAVDLQAPYASLNGDVNSFAQALIGGGSSYCAEFATARSHTQEFYYPTYVDLYDFAHQVNLYVSDSTINAAATEVMNAVDSAVIHEQHGTSWPGAHGISVYFPESEGDYDSNYDGSAGQLQFTANTEWDEWLHAFYACGPALCNDPHEPNDTPGQATPISYGTLIDADICPAEDVDYYALTASAGETIIVDIDAYAIGSDLDSYLYLYDTDGVTELVHNDDHDGLDSYLAYTFPADGTYYLMVRDYYNGGEPDYFYTISLSSGTCSDPHESNDTPGQATPISPGKLNDPDICPGGDVDYYAFAGEAGEEIVVDIDAQAIGSGLDSYLYLYDTDGVTELAHNDDYDGLDSHIEYALPADGTYYLMVRDYYDGGGPDCFYTISLAKEFDVDTQWTADAPTIDGHIAPGEWDAAATFDITNARTVQKRTQDSSAISNLPGTLPEGMGSPSSLPEPKRRLSPVILYAMNDEGHLYLAIDNPNDTTMDSYDQMGAYFDDNPLPSDGQWTNTSCGNPDGEGNFWVLVGNVDYREWIVGPATCSVVSPAPGAPGSVGYASGHTQIEIAIDLTSSALRATPGDAINMYMWIYDASAGAFDGQWPITAMFDDPSTYRALTLSACAVPAAPDLSSPGDGDNTCDTTPTFSWSSVSGAISYQIQVDDDSGFSSPEIDDATSDVTYTPVALLSPRAYYWRVRASRGCGNGAWSSVRSFTVLAAPSTPTLISPPDGSEMDDPTPTFCWSSVSGATSCRIQVDDDSSFSSPVVNETTAGTSWTPGSALARGVTLHWRVRAVNVCGGGPWSSPRTFTVHKLTVYLPTVVRNR